MSPMENRAAPETGVWATLSDHEEALWALVVGAMLADVLLTYYGLERGFTESNPVARLALERIGYASLAVLKLVALAVGAAGRWALPPGYAVVVPLGLAIPWIIASLVNAALIGLAA